MCSFSQVTWRLEARQNNARNRHTSIAWTPIHRITINARDNFVVVHFINEIRRLRLITHSANRGGTRGFMRIFRWRPDGSNHAKWNPSNDPTDFARSNGKTLINELDKQRFLREFLYKEMFSPFVNLTLDRIVKKLSNFEGRSRHFEAQSLHQSG